MTPVNTTMLGSVLVALAAGLALPVAARDVATIPLLAAPRIGDFLRHPDGDYVIDNLYQDNGVNKRYVLRPATTAEIP